MKWHSPHKKRKKAKKRRHNKLSKNTARKTSISKNKKYINNRNIEVHQITINPLEHFPKFFQNSLKRKFMPTFETINKFLKGGQYNVDLNYASLDNGKQRATFPLKMKSNLKGVSFEITLPNNFVHQGVRHKESYGLDEPLKIYNDQESYFIERGCIVNFETIFSRTSLSLKGNFTQVRTFETLEVPTYLRCIIPTNDNDMVFPGFFLDSEPKCILFDIDSLSLHCNNSIGIPMPSSGGHYYNLTINDFNILFYGVEVKNNCCLVIDSLKKIDIDNFEKIVCAVRLVYAFFTGRFYKEEVIILSSENSEFDEIRNFFYSMEEESVITDFQIVDFELFYHIISAERNSESKKKYEQYRKKINPEIFSSMCKMVLGNNKFKRVLELITSAGNNNNPIIQGALYSVALETLTQIIYDENAEALAPMPKDVFKKMRDELIRIFSTYKDKMDERGKKIIESKILNMNSPTNRDKLEKPFEIVGITLSGEDKKTINMRNMYLHGNEPENSYEWFLKEQLNSLDILDLIIRLILKYFKYEGHYFSPQFKYVLNNETAKKIITEEFDLHQYKNVLKKLKNNEFESLKEIEEAQVFVEKFRSYIGVLNILSQKVELI